MAAVSESEPPKDPNAAENSKPPRRLNITIVRATGLKHLNHLSKTGIFCICESGRQGKHTAKFQTQAHQPDVAGKTLAAVWNEEHELDWNVGDPIEFTVCEKGLIGSKTEGKKVVLPSDEFFPCGFAGELPIEGLENASITVKISWPGIAVPGVAVTEYEGSGFARLIVKVDRGENLTPCDTTYTIHGIEKTLDAFVQLAINDNTPFGQTEVKWKSKGYAEWAQAFSVDVAHPQSFLCVYVCDDRGSLMGSVVNTATAGIIEDKTNCGFIEIPLAQLTANERVCGWFALSAPVNQDDSLADRRAETAEKNDAKEHAKHVVKGEGAEKGEASPKHIHGRVKLELLLQTTFKKEVMGYMQPEPVFTRSMPDLDLEWFLNDVNEVKRLLLDRLVLPIINTVLYAISWENPMLSSSLVCWHWFLWYQPRYTWASIWVVVALAFWHKPQFVEEGVRASSDAAAKRLTRAESTVVSGTIAGVSSLAQGITGAVTSIISKPIEGAYSGGVVGFVQGVGSGVLDSVASTGMGVVGLTTNVGSGLVGSLTNYSPGLAEFQTLLNVFPGLRDSLQAWQNPMNDYRATLQQVDDLFYGKDPEMTAHVRKCLAGLFLASLALSRWIRALSGVGWLLGGSVILLSNASFFKKFVRLFFGLVAVYTKPKEPFKRSGYFESATKR